MTASPENRPAGLLLDPTVVEAKRAIDAAIDGAANARDTLILAYIGHGELPDESSRDFYLMPIDASEPNSAQAIHFPEFISDRIKLRRDDGGLIVLLDVCHSGAGALLSMERWAQSLRANIGLELLITTNDRATADASLTRTVIELLERGDPTAPERIRCRDVYRRLKDQKRPSQHVSYNAADDRYYLARNIALDPGDVFWKDSAGRAQILKMTEYFQPTPQLTELVEASRSHQVVVMTGEAGAGKSTLAAALVRPEITGGVVPNGFVQAIAFLDPTSNLRSLGNDLALQLRRSIPSFVGAVAEFEQSVPIAERQKLDFLRHKCCTPWTTWAHGPLFVLSSTASTSLRRRLAGMCGKRSTQVRTTYF